MPSPALAGYQTSGKWSTLLHPLHGCLGLESNDSSKVVDLLPDPGPCSLEWDSKRPWSQLRAPSQGCYRQGHRKEKKAGVREKQLLLFKVRHQLYFLPNNTWPRHPRWQIFFPLKWQGFLKGRLSGSSHYESLTWGVSECICERERETERYIHIHTEHKETQRGAGESHPRAPLRDGSLFLCEDHWTQWEKGLVP